MRNDGEKAVFAARLKAFAATLGDLISKDNEWTIRGFIDIFRNIYTISSDTKVISKILELHLFPHFLSFAESIHYDLILAAYQNWYPDLTFVSQENPEVKFAVDLKTTYRNPESPDYCNGFTLGSHGEYFINRTSTKNIQYPYDEYSGHFCLGVIYTRNDLGKDTETKRILWKRLRPYLLLSMILLFSRKRNGRSPAIKAEAAIPQTSEASREWMTF